MTNHSPLSAARLIPVICDRCRAEGLAAADPFEAFGALLDFEPVPRLKNRADGWDAEVQRAYIAALSLTGTDRAACRAVGKSAFGIKQLLDHEGSEGFRAAREEALAIAGDERSFRLAEGLRAVAAEQAGWRPPDPPWSRAATRRAPPAPPPPFDDGYDQGEDGAIGSWEVREARARISDRLLRARRLFLAGISDNLAKRIAWELLCGPVDWDKAALGEPQDNEPYGIPAMREPDMLIPADAGLLPDLTGGPDALEAMRRELERIEEEEQAAAESDPPEGDERDRGQSI